MGITRGTSEHLQLLGSETHVYFVWIIAMKEEVSY